MEGAHGNIADAKNQGCRRQHQPDVEFSQGRRHKRQRQGRADRINHPVRRKRPHLKPQFLTHRRVKNPGAVVNETQACSLQDAAARQYKPCIMYFLTASLFHCISPVFYFWDYANIHRTFSILCGRFAPDFIVARLLRNS